MLEVDGTVEECGESVRLTAMKKFSGSSSIICSSESSSAPIASRTAVAAEFFLSA